MVVDAACKLQQARTVRSTRSARHMQTRQINSHGVGMPQISVDVWRINKPERVLPARGKERKGNEPVDFPVQYV